MARPCGCSGECGCTYIGVDGVRVTGTGTTRDPGRIGLSNPLTGLGCDAVMSCVGARVAGGLRYDSTARTIAVRLSADSGNNLVFGSDNGLYGAGGAGGGTSGATVASLPTFVVGGSYGAGYAMHPEGNIDTYRVAADLDLIKLIHAPVRRTREYQLVCQHQRNLGQYNFRWSGTNTDAVDLAQAEQMWYIPGGDPTAMSGGVFGSTFEAKGGYFGHGWRDSYAVPLLTDVLRTIDKRQVLYLEVKDLGASVSETPVPLHTFSVLKDMIRRWGAQKNVIVSAAGGGAMNTADRTSIEDGLELLRQDGVDVGLHFTSTGHMDQYPPATMVTKGYKWAAFPPGTLDTDLARINTYKAAGINTLIYSVTRQWEYNKAKGAALKGLLSADPQYAGGVESLYRYIRRTATWGPMTPDHGRHSYVGDIENSRDVYRGYVIRNEPGRICIDGTTKVPGQTNPAHRPSAYYILQGEQCPMPPSTGGDPLAPNNYDISVGFIWDSLISDRTRWMGVFFGVPEDRPLLDWTYANTNTKGYLLSLEQNGTARFLRYDGIPFPNPPDGPATPNPYQYSTSWASGTGTITPGVEYRVNIYVRPTEIAISINSSPPIIFNNTLTPTAGATTWRGPYFYLGRHFFTDADSTRCRFSNLVTAVN